MRTTACPATQLRREVLQMPRGWLSRERRAGRERRGHRVSRTAMMDVGCGRQLGESQRTSSRQRHTSGKTAERPKGCGQ